MKSIFLQLNKLKIMEFTSKTFVSKIAKQFLQASLVSRVTS